MGKYNQKSNIDRPIFIEGSTLFKIVGSFFDRLIRLIGAFTRHRRKRYVQLTPTTLSTQLILDRNNYSIFKIYVRDKIDLGTIRQVFLADDYGLKKLKRNNEIVDYYKSIIDAGRTPLIIDCGGNIGLASRYFSDNFPEATVLCIEPDAENIKQAQANNISSNVIFFENAVGSSLGTGNILDNGLGNNAFQIEKNEKGTTQIISINHLLEQYRDNRYTPFIIKIDIEGFEDDLFSEHTDWVNKFPLLIIELHDWMLPKTGNSSNFLRTISTLNRDFVFFGENVYSISNSI